MAAEARKVSQQAVTPPCEQDTTWPLLACRRIKQKRSVVMWHADPALTRNCALTVLAGSSPGMSLVWEAASQSAAT